MYLKKFYLTLHDEYIVYKGYLIDKISQDSFQVTDEVNFSEFCVSYDEGKEMVDQICEEDCYSF